MSEIKVAGIEAIAWDLDGTIINSFALYEEIIERLAKERGMNVPSRETMLSNYHGTLDDTLSNTFSIDSPGKIAELVGHFIDMQDTHFATDIDRYFYADAIKLATKAGKKGLRQAVVTNRGHKDRNSASPRSIIQRSEIVHFIHEIRCGDEVEWKKPDARVLQDWLDRHSILPERLLVIGDQFVDAQLAINLGARVVLAARNGNIPHLDTLPKAGREDVVIVDSLEEVELV